MAGGNLSCLSKKTANQIQDSYWWPESLPVSGVAETSTSTGSKAVATESGKGGRLGTRLAQPSMLGIKQQVWLMAQSNLIRRLSTDAH